MADANSSIVRFAAESAFGTVASAAGQILRTTGSTWQPIKETAISQEIVSTKVVSDYADVGDAGRLTLNYEWTYAVAEWLTLMQGMFESTWTVDTPATGTDRLVNGTTTTSYSIEIEFDDITVYKTFKGCVPESMSMSLTPGEIVTGSMSFLCKDSSLMAATTAFTGSTAASTTTPMTVTAAGLTAVKEGGGASTLLLSADWTLNRNLTPRRPLGADSASSITRGRLTIEGSLAFDLTDLVLFSKYEDHTESSLQFTLTDGTNITDWTFPAIRYLTAEPQVTGVDGSADVQATWGAKDNGSGVMVQVDRT
jgi:hypothetical protein